MELGGMRRGGREVPVQRDRGRWDRSRTRWGCSRHWPKRQRDAGGRGCGQAAAGQGGTFRRSPRLFPEHRWVTGVVGREGLGGEEEKGSRLLLPLAPRAGLGLGASPVPAAAPRAAPALRGPRHGSGSGGCHHGSHRQNRWQLNPYAGFGGLQHWGGSCLSKGTESKRELSHRLGISAPWGWGGSRQRPAFVAGGREEPEPGQALGSAPRARCCPLSPGPAPAAGTIPGCSVPAGPRPAAPRPLRGGTHGMKEPARSGRETWQKDDGAALDAFPPGRRKCKHFLIGEPNGNETPNNN